MPFEILGEIDHVELIASGHGIRVLDRLVRQFGRGNWRKMKGFATVRLMSGRVIEVEYEAHGIGKRKMRRAVRAGELGPIRRSTHRRVVGGYTAVVPTLLRNGPYRVYVTSHDMGEPPHVHVDREQSSAKFWLSPVRLAYGLGFSARELRVIEDILEKTEHKLLAGWHDYFGT